MLFEPQSEDAVRRAVTRAKYQRQNQMSELAQVAFDYLEGRVWEDCRAELQHRFPNSMSGDSGQQIFPFCVNLTERYVAEAASIYNRPVRRYFVDADGKESDATMAISDQYKRFVEDDLDECLHRAEQIMHLLWPAPATVWFQAKRGKLRPVVSLPYDVHPVAPDGPQFVDSTDPEDYEGYIVQVDWDGADSGDASQRTWVYITRAQLTYFQSSEPHRMGKVLSQHANPYEWEQVVDKEAEDGSLVPQPPRMLPGQMLTFWHARKPLDSILPDTDTEIVSANREINVALSALLDNMRFQGHAVPVKKLQNVSSAKAKQRHGVRFPAVLDLAESFELISAATNYADQVGLLKDLVRMLAVAKRLSPNDFALEGGAVATSGFAKMVDALPKLEARQERAKRMRKLERMAAPRILAIGTYLGKIDEAARDLQYRVEFSDVEFPRTEDERSKRIESDIKHDLSTPAKILAKRLNLSEAEAQAQIEANRAVNGGLRQEQRADRQASLGGGLFGQRIRGNAQPAS